jgi:hypothetical protein
VPVAKQEGLVTGDGKLGKSWQLLEFHEGREANMAEFRTWLEAIEANHFDEWTREQLISEMPHTYFVGNLPPDFAFLQGRYVDLGFENLGLTPEEHRKIMLAFGGVGVQMPDTQLRLRFAYPNTVVEPVDGTEQAVLPDDWRQAVIVTNNDDKFTWIGKRVRPDQYGQIDFNLYHDEGDGYRLKGK